MEQEAKYVKKRPLLRAAVLVVLLLIAMYILAVLGYYFARKSAPQAETRNAQDGSEYSVSEEEQNPFHLPTAMQTEVPEEALPENTPTFPKQDYLVLADGAVVSLFILTETGEQVFSEVLPISLAALIPEDRVMLEEGVILRSRGELAALLEDLSS